MSQKNCPVCAIPMREIKAESTYDTPVFIDQCDTCGGLWFDDSEIYRIKIGEANDIEGVDKEKLRSKTEFQTENAQCPNDQSLLNKFRDPSYPDSLHICSCPKCDGLWVNRGQFVEFQKQREEIIERNTVAERSIASGEGKAFDEKIQKLLAEQSTRSDSLGHFANFLSTPINPLTNRAMSDSEMGINANQAIGIAFGILNLIFRLFL